MLESILMSANKVDRNQYPTFRTNSRFTITNDGKTAAHSSGQLSTWSQLLLNTEVQRNTGKYYIEFLVEGMASFADGVQIGISIGTNSNNENFGSDNANVYVYSSIGQRRHSSTYYAYGEAYTVGDLVGISFDSATTQIRAYKNGVDQGIMENNIATTPTFKLGIYIYQTGTPYSARLTIPPTTMNAPSGFKPWPA